MKKYFLISIFLIYAQICWATGSQLTGQKIYQSVCADCHDGGFWGWLSGAPKLGVKNEWEEFLSKGISGLVDAAIKKSNLGLNPQIDGQLIRLPVPELNEERRTELKKLIKSIGEKCKVSIRNIRREANEDLKKLLKSKEIGEDEEKSFEKNVQNITDKHIQIVDDKVSSKEKEIMTI